MEGNSKNRGRKSFMVKTSKCKNRGNLTDVKEKKSMVINWRSEKRENNKNGKVK